MAYWIKEATEHAGAKNGGGAWMRRVDAKLQSNKARRRNERRFIDQEEQDSRSPFVFDRFEVLADDDVVQ